MEIFDEIGKTVNSFAQNTVQKSKELTEITKLKLTLSNQKTALENAYSDFGKACYAQHSETADASEEAIKDLFDAITTQIANVRETEQKLMDIKNMNTCLQCSAKTSKDNNFCPNCGAKL